MERGDEEMNKKKIRALFAHKAAGMGLTDLVQWTAEVEASEQGFDSVWEKKITVRRLKKALKELE